MSDYSIGRGESKTFTHTVTSTAGDLVDLTDAEITFVVFDLDKAVVFTKRSLEAGGSADEIEIPAQTDDDLGTFILKLGTLDTDLAQAARWADCWVVTAADPPETIKVDEHSPFFVHGEPKP